MAKKPIDPQRAEKWATRAAEWNRLADLAEVDHVADMCRRFAKSSQDMSGYWSGQ